MFNISEILCIKEAVKEQLRSWIETQGRDNTEIIEELEGIIEKATKIEHEYAMDIKAAKCLKERST